MKLMLDVEMKSPARKITYTDKFFLIGSCFTEHIGRKLGDAKFPVLQNPNGILFDPVSVTQCINSCIEGKIYSGKDLFFLNELWQSWNYHSSFSGMEMEKVLEKINSSQIDAHEYLKNATCLIITLGSSFSYRLQENGRPVANCHRAPGQWFTKHLLTTGETTNALIECIEKLKAFNPALQIIFTISPVRHIRDGVVENNRSKARLIEAVHHVIELYEHTFYFPAYELVIDVLRDYRFYDVDLVHPNYAATEIVFERFEQSFIDDHALKMMEEIRKVMTAYKHKSFHPGTDAHRSFLKNSLQKIIQIQSELPHIDFSKELAYFSGEASGQVRPLM